MILDTQDGLFDFFGSGIDFDGSDEATFHRTDYCGALYVRIFK